MLGRILNAVGYLVSLISAAQVGGFLDLLPDPVTAVLIAVGATLSSFTERIQGGISKTGLVSSESIRREK